ncbi:NUDIX domain-containing protein [Arthrobacter sp. MDT1-65]
MDDAARERAAGRAPKRAMAPDPAPDPAPDAAVPALRVRAATYLLRGRGAGREVLVVDHVHHPEAGTQVPGGGVEAGETLDAAARREVLEETGLLLAGPLTAVGVAHLPAPAGPGTVTVFFSAATDDRRASWDHTVTGGAARPEPGSDAGLLFRCSFVPLSRARAAGTNHHFSCVHLLR